MSGIVYLCVGSLIVFFAAIALSVMWVSGQVANQNGGER